MAAQNLTAAIVGRLAPQGGARMLGKALVCATLAGCAPVSLRPAAEHVSHMTNHRHGENVLSLSLVWHGPFTVEVGEGYSVHGIDGCLDCPREQFHARVYWEIPLTHGP